MKDALAKLFKKTQFKDVGELVLYSHGRPSDKGSFSLAGLIALLDRSEDERDVDWLSAMAKYEEYLSSLLGPNLERSLSSEA